MFANEEHNGDENHEYLNCETIVKKCTKMYLIALFGYNSDIVVCLHFIINDPSY